MAAQDTAPTKAQDGNETLEELAALLPRLPDPKTMSHGQKDRERKLFRDRLKALNAVPRSDWHRGFEDILQIEIESWNNGSVLHREVSVGEDAPRADFIMVNSAGLPPGVKSVFRIFRRKNAIEFKRPTEPLTEKMIWKTGGYGNLLIGTSQGTEYEAEELTLSVFAGRKHGAQFDSLLRRGVVQTTETAGIYRVVGMTPLPYQIVLSEELEGRDYAAYRALSDHAVAEDISVLLDTMKLCPVPARDRYLHILQTIELHNPGTVRNMIQEEGNMNTIFMDLFEPEIQERERKAAASAAATANEAKTKEFAERMIRKGLDGPCIADVTGYDRSRIDGIARRLNRTVEWNENRA